MQNYNEAVTIVGSSNEAQLVVQGHSTQTEALQEWQDSSAEPLARMTANGRLQIGNFDEGTMATDDSLIEAHRADTDTTKPKRGLHLRGIISDALSPAISWAAHELTLKGTNGLAALHTALRIRVRNETTGAAGAGAELRGADIDLTHAGTASGATASKLVGLHVGVNQETGADSNHLYGIKVNFTNLPTETYALHANHGKMLLGDLGTGIVQVIDGELSILEEALGGSSEVVATWGEAVSLRDAVYLNSSDNKWYKAENDATSPLHMGGVRGFVSDAGTGAINTTGTVLQAGLLTGFSGLTPDAPLYASATAGLYTQTKPTLAAGAGQMIVAPMGYAVSATDVMVETSAEIQYLKRESLANNASLMISHHNDVQGRERQPSAYLLSYDIVMAETYAASNQDADVQLRGQAGAGATNNVDTVGAVTYALGDQSGTDYRIAQSFQVTAGKLTSFSVRFAATTGTPTAVPNWSIRSDNAGVPAATTLISGTMPTITPSADNTVTVTGGPYLYASTTYWLVLELPAMQATNNFYTVNRNSANPYALGVMKTDSTTGASFPGTWTALAAGSDLRCSFVTSAVSAHDKISQGVQHSTTATVTSIKLWLKKVGLPSGSLTCALYSDSSGSPNSAITSGTASTVSASSLGTAYGWVTFSFPTPPTLSGSTAYHIVLSTSDSQNSSHYVVWGVDTTSPSYSSGVLKTQVSSTWSAAPTADGCFEMYAQDADYKEQLVVGRYSGGTRDLAVRFDDGTGGNGNTSTTFKNVSGGTLDVTCTIALNS